MTTTAPPGLLRTSRDTPRHLLEHRLRVIDQRRAQIEAQLLAAPGDGSYKSQELQTELAALLTMRQECDSILNPRPQPPRHPALEAAYAKQRAADRLLLRSTIKTQRQQIEWNAQREEAAGNHRQARLLRMEIPELAGRVCKEFGKDPALLAEIEDDDNGKTTKENSPQVRNQRNQRRR